MEPVSRTGRPANPRPAVRTAAAKGTDDPDALAHEEAIAVQHADFDFAMAERAELAREANVMRDMMLEQLKTDEESLKKYIAMI